MHSENPTTTRQSKYDGQKVEGHQPTYKMQERKSKSRKIKLSPIELPPCHKKKEAQEVCAHHPSRLCGCDRYPWMHEHLQAK